MSSDNDSTGIVVVTGAAIVTAAILSMSVRLRPDVEVQPSIDVSILTSRELLRSFRTKSVCDELLNRPDVEIDDLQAAMTRLSVLRGQEAGIHFLNQVTNLAEDDPEARRRNLSHLTLFIAETSQFSQSAFRDELLALAQSQNAASATVAIAAIVTLDDSVDKLIGPVDVEQLLKAMPFVDRFAVSIDVYGFVRGHIADESEAVADAAILSAVQLSSAHDRLARDLIEMLQQDPERVSCIGALARVNVEAFPDTQLGFVASRFIARAAEVVTEEDLAEFYTLERKCQEISDRLSTQQQKRIRNRLAELRRILATDDPRPNHSPL